MSKLIDLQMDLAQLLNHHGIDSMVNMNDHVLAEYLVDCIKSLNKANNRIMYTEPQDWRMKK